MPIRTPPVHKGPFGKITLLFISTVMVFLLADLFLSRFPEIKTPPRKFFIDYNPLLGVFRGNCYTSNPRHYFPATVTVQETGRPLYCIFYDVAKRRRGYFPERINEAALVGDSFVFWEGLKEEDTLGYLLGTAYPQLNFRNFGRSGANIAVVQKTVTGILEEQPAVRQIIYFYNINDVLVSETLAKQEKRITDFENIRWIRRRPAQNPLIRLLERSTLLSLIERTFILQRESALTVSNYRAMYTPGMNKEALEKTTQTLIAIQKQAREKGVRFSVVIYPLLYKDILGRYPFAFIHAWVKRTCDAHNIPCIDVYPALQQSYSLKEFTVHPIDYHPNGQANKRVAAYLKTHAFIPQEQAGGR